VGKEELKRFILVSIISADNDALTEDIKQQILSRMSEEKEHGREDLNMNMSYILEPIEDVEARKRLIQLLTN